MIHEVAWPDVADTLEDMGREHWAEASGGVVGEYRLNRNLLDLMHSAGMLRTIVARDDDRITGYLIWTRDVSVECTDANGWEMGPWYAAPGAACGGTLLRWCIDRFREEGAQRVRLHHTVHGRGAKAAVLFQRLGAKPYQTEYRLNLGA
jgi:hypothetical protein